MSPLPPGPRSSLGTITGYLRNPLYCLLPIRERYGDPFTIPGKRPMVCTGDPEGIRTIYTAAPESLEPLADDLAVFLGNTSMILVAGGQHRRLRKLTMPPFHGARMRAYGEAICRSAERHLSDWTAGRTIATVDVMQRISLDVILQSVFGVSEPARMAELGDSVLDVVNGISPLLALFPSLRRELGGIGPFARFVRRQRRMHEQLDALIAGAREVEPRDDVLSLLVHARDEDGEPMSDEEIRDQLLLLVAAGYETTAISLAWALYALHQPDSSEVLDRLLAELDALGPEPDPAQLHALEYLDAVCHETLRRYPLAPAPAPRRLLAPLDLMGHSLPVGTGVVTAIGIAHFREATYPDPMRFDPQRFIDGKFTPFEYLPFGGGARRCLGAALASYEMRLVLATVLRRCRLQLASLREDRGKVRGVNVGPARGVRVVVEERREGP